MPRFGEGDIILIGAGLVDGVDAATQRARVSGHRRIGERESASAGEVNSGAAAGAVI